MATRGLDNPDVMVALQEIRDAARRDMADEGGARVAGSMLDLPETVMWDVMAIMVSPSVLDLCGQEDWYRKALRSVLIGMLIRVDAKSASALLDANNRMFGDDEDEELMP